VSKDALPEVTTDTEANPTKPSSEEPLQSILMKKKMGRPRKPRSELSFESEMAKFHKVMAEARKIIAEEEELKGERMRKQQLANQGTNTQRMPSGEDQELPSHMPALRMDVQAPHDSFCNVGEITGATVTQAESSCITNSPRKHSTRTNGQTLALNANDEDFTEEDNNDNIGKATDVDIECPSSEDGKAK